MAATHFSGPVIAGDIREGATPNIGNVSLVQTGTITQNSTTAVDLTFTLPANAQVISTIVDVLTAYDSGTSATLSVGRTSGGTELASGVNVKAATGRIAVTYTATQLTNMANITTNTSVIATVTVVGATTAGLVRVSIHYVQR